MRIGRRGTERWARLVDGEGVGSLCKGRVGTVCPVAGAGARRSSSFIARRSRAARPLVLQSRWTRQRSDICSARASFRRSESRKSVRVVVRRFLLPASSSCRTACWLDLLLWQAKMTRTHPFQTVDAFTSSPFRGNPAAVLRFGSSPEEQALARDDDLMQKIAAEFNLAETAFCRALGEEETPEYEIRWRTPTVEVRL